MNITDLKFLGDTIKANREEMNLTLRGFSKLTGVSFSQLSKIERGEHRPTRETIDKISQHIRAQKVWLYMMAGYSEKFLETFEKAKKETEQNPFAYIADEDKEMVRSFVTTQHIQESPSHYSANGWEAFIAKMESMKLSPQDLEEIVENYQNIRTIVLKREGGVKE
ncbi:helix-turn-helix domain-containing protein [Bacillus sp. REN16]|uniref:helix-turn-helix domain-containing protein n=1 Tax=Bacillus sp. REN16 TaxID=2887296 RepID=UPI001E2CED39|nr:helix-turn-helix transcriptional regulator [Bacillus sp. REN16]MCC3359119.1 helix-turn-helix transcriptional regulator [Bacillus sp. REN16]